MTQDSCFFLMKGKREFNARRRTHSFVGENLPVREWLRQHASGVMSRASSCLYYSFLGNHTSQKKQKQLLF